MLKVHSILHALVDVLGIQMSDVLSTRCHDGYHDAAIRVKTLCFLKQFLRQSLNLSV